MHETKWDLYGYVLASKHRQKLLKVLEQKPMTPSQISNFSSVSITHVSRSIAELRSKNLVVCLNPNSLKGKLYSLTEDGRRILDLL